MKQRQLIVLRKEQREAMARAQFTNWMVLHLKKHFPKRCEALGQEKILKRINQGIERSKLYGIVERRHICRFINVMICLGRNFDTDPRYPWVAAILNDSSLIDIEKKMDRLVKASVNYLEKLEQERAEIPVSNVQT